MKIEQLRNQIVISQTGLLGLYGYTETGNFVLAPNSYSRGYRNSFLPPIKRPYMVSNILGLFGKLSNNACIFIPSYNGGLSHGNECQQNLKFTILAEGERRLIREVQMQRQELREAQNKIKELEEIAEGERKLFHEVQMQRQELREAQNKIKELEEKLSKRLQPP